MSVNRRIDGSDLFLGIAALAGSAGYLYETSQIAESPLEDAVGARGVPAAVGWVMAGLGVILCSRGLFFGARIDALSESSITRERLPAAMRRHLVALGLLGILAAYVIILPYGGYVVATALLIGAVACFSGAPLRRTLPLIAVAGAVALWIMFDPLLGISLPVGSWWQGR